MKSTLPLLLLLAACPTPDADPKLDEATDTAAADTAGDDSGDDTELGYPETDEEGEGDADWGPGACEYTVTAVGADEVVDYLGGTPAEFAALVSGTRSTTFHFDVDSIDTTLDHTLTVDASTARLWRGEWLEREGDDTPTEEEASDSGGGSSGGGSSGSDGSGAAEAPPGDPDRDTGPTDTEYPTDTGVVFPDTGTWGDTGDDGPRCPDYLTAEADWTFVTGEGSFAEAMRVTVRAHSLPIARIDHTVDAAAIAGTFAPPVEDPAAWDELRVGFAASVGADDVDYGEVGVFGTRTWSTSDDTADDDSPETDVAEAFMGDVARWPAPGP